jgi:predicted Rossmann fold flavoprotein
MSSELSVIIGGGAAGIMAAISKARRGEPVVICEKNNRIGKKILATGNGRCNLLNENLDEDFYNQSSRSLVRTVFSRFGKVDILRFFKEIGLSMYSQEGRIFPATNQAASVLRVLELELGRLSVPVEYGFDCTRLSFQKDCIIVISNAGKQITCQKVIITGGGKTYPSFGSDGSTFMIARQLGHTIIEPVPSAVPLVVKDPLCQLLQGQRIQARVQTLINGQATPEISGELLFTKYGLSGTCILDVSGPISIAINRNHQTKVTILVDLVPFMERQHLKDELSRRQQAGFSTDDMLSGILPNKFSLAFKPLFETNSIDNVVNHLKSRPFSITATRGWNEAEFTCGGVNIAEIQPDTLESKLVKNVYFAGEVLDVDGKRGGYNLAWAWASGYIAGLTYS